ncbi:hypothetical protein BDZ97DRAFT_89235 [Flammula alnicola]|nr:hypothetical protein BDZ97DRAFT_89235 [Flammula alnicola]
MLKLDQARLTTSTVSHTMAQQLPHELDELILKNLRGDMISLKACSLVCHRFASISQQLLFDDVVLDFLASAYLVHASHSIGPQRFKTLLESSPHISELIHSLDIFPNTFRLQTLDDILLPSLPLLVNLRSIGLVTDYWPRPISWPGLSLDMQRALSTAFHSKNIGNIRLRCVFEVPLSLLAECSTLEGLSLNSITFLPEDISKVSEGLWEAPPLKQCPRLKSLHLRISNPTFRNLLTWLMVQNCTLDISMLLQLSISIFNDRFDYSNVDKLLRLVAKSLEVLCFSPLVPESQLSDLNAEMPGPLPLSLLSRLRIFRLRVVDERRSRAPQTTLRPSFFKDLVLNVINQLNPSQGIEELSIKLHWFEEPEGGLHDRDTFLWSALDKTLAAFPTLRLMTVIILQSETDLHPEIVEEIQNGFPLLHSQSILRVEAISTQSGF